MAASSKTACSSSSSRSCSSSSRSSSSNISSSSSSSSSSSGSTSSSLTRSPLRRPGSADSRVSEVTLGPFLGFRSSHQQQHQQQAAAGSSRQQQAAGSRRQQQAAADTSRGSSRQRQAAAKFQFYSRVSEVTLGPFLGFLCDVFGTKLGGALLFRMCFEKSVWLFVSCFGGCLIAAAPQQHHSSN